MIYRDQPNPEKVRKDTKYTVLFRGCLLRIESEVVQREQPSEDLTLNVVLEEGAKNAGDALRFFELAKKEHLPGWEHLLGTMTLGDKTLYGLQAADLLVSGAYKLERMNHRHKPTDIEQSPHVLPSGETGGAGFKEYRMPITKETLSNLAADFLKPPEQWETCRTRRVFQDVSFFTLPSTFKVKDQIPSLSLACSTLKLSSSTSN